MKRRLVALVLVVLCMIMATPALALENPYRHAGDVTELDIPVPLETDGMKSAGSSGIEFRGAGYTHRIGRVSIAMNPLDQKLDGKIAVDGNLRRYTTNATVIEHEVYRDLVKERVILNAPAMVRYSYDLALSDWMTIEPDESRPVEIRDANNTVIVTYPYTKEVTNYAKDSTIDISPDRWGNLVVYVNGEDVVVMPKPFAIDAAGKRFEMDFKLDKKAKTITVAGDLAGAKYPVTVDPTERVTNGGFETGNKSGWTGSYSVASGGAYQGTYYLDVVGSGGYTTLSQSISYTGATSVSNAAAIPVRNTYDIPMSDIAISGWHWLVNAPGQNVQGWTPRSTSPGLTGSGNLVIWTYSSTHGHLDSVAVNPPLPDPPVADFTGTPLTGTAPLTVQFSDQSTNSPTSWSWSFGDGGTSTVQNPSHQYTSAGTYTVSLTAANAAGSDGETKAGYVTVSAPTYSMTNIELYDTISDLDPWGTNVCSIVSNWLGGSAGWPQLFYDTNGNVNDPDFGSQDSGYLGLDGSVLHYHFGHGVLDNGETYVTYSDYPVSSLSHQDVYKKWDTTNKWVIFDACNILNNTQWGGALKYSHGILGFTTPKTASTDLPARFFQNLIDNDYTVAYSWKHATEQTYPNSGIVARVIFDTQEQLDNDHLNGQGTIAPDEYPDDDTIFVSTWTC